MVIREAENRDTDCVAPLVAKFRDTLRGFKGYPSRDDLSAAREEWMGYFQPSFSAFIAHEGEPMRRLSGMPYRRADGLG